MQKNNEIYFAMGGISTTMKNAKLPKKILHIEDMTFVLPEDFVGGINEALEEAMKHLRAISNSINVSEKVGEDDTSSIEEIVYENAGKIDLKYGLMERKLDGTYKIVDIIKK